MRMTNHDKPVTWRPPFRLNAQVKARAEREGWSFSEALNTLLVEALRLPQVEAERDRLREDLDSTRAMLNSANDVLRQIALQMAKEREENGDTQ